MVEFYYSLKKGFVMPKVSVLTPIYNTNPEHLRECIESILNQTFTDFEFLILNDSPDNKEIEDIILSYKDKRIKYFKNSKNLGISKSRNKLLGLATGEYVAIFDHDDISVPERLEEEVRFLDEHPLVGAVSGWLKLFHDKNTIWKTPELDHEIKIKMTENVAFYHTASMIRRELFQKHKLEYEEFYSPAEDYALWARMMRYTYFYNLQKVLVKYRYFADNTSHKQYRKMMYAHDAIQLEIINEFPAYRQEFIYKYRRLQIKLFGFIPLLKIKNKVVYLFNLLPIAKVER